MMTYTKTIASIGLGALLTMSVSAQQQGGDGQGSQQQRQQEQQASERGSGERNRSRRARQGESGQQSDRSQRDRSGQGQQNQSDLDGWVQVAYDYDRDGRWDATEFIFFYDLEQAQTSSRARRAQQGEGSRSSAGDNDNGNGDGNGDSNRGRARKTDSAKARQRAQTRSVSGTIQSLQTKRFKNASQPHRFAKVEADDGRMARIDLGPIDQLQRLDLQRGDQVTVQGRRGTIDERGVLMAERIETDQNQVSIDRNRTSLKRLSGKVQSSRDVTFRETGERHKLLLVKPDGRDRALLVDLGRAADADRNGIRDGEQLTLLVLPGKIQGKQALFATSYRIGDRSHDVRRKGESASGRAGSATKRDDGSERSSRTGNSREKEGRESGGSGMDR